MGQFWIFLSLNHLEFNLNKNHYFDKKTSFAIPGGGRVRAVFEKWASAKRPKVARFQIFYHFEFKILIEQGLFSCEKLPGSKITLVGMGALGPQPRTVKFSKKFFFCCKKSLCWNFQLNPLSNNWDIWEKGWVFVPRPWPYRPIGEEKKFWDMTFCQNWCKKNFSLFFIASREIIGVKFRERQTVSQIPWHHIRMGVCFFLQ